MTEDAWDGISERRLQSQKCQQDILDRLTRIEVEFALVRGVLKKIEGALNGNGREGLLISHDRIAQKVHGLFWALGVIFAALVMVGIKAWLG